MQSLLIASVLGFKCAQFAATPVPPAPVLNPQIVAPVETPFGRAEVPVGANRPFSSGERFRLRLAAPAYGYLYVVTLDPRDEIRVLYSLSNDVPGGIAWKTQSRTVPEDAWFRFDNTPGAEDVYVVWSIDPLTRFEDALRGARLELDDVLDLQHLANAEERYGGPATLAVERIRLLHAEDGAQTVLR